ncbi:unnamed protein product [Lactuca saligna]|uniref:Uncharacterized protein n=1 Tax=Lactuca saligna TaxID=75948 RepID=A0AA36E053_LACSI|nr:unnamed protein product [Lactuca saligna]
MSMFMMHSLSTILVDYFCRFVEFNHRFTLLSDSDCWSTKQGRNLATTLCLTGGEEAHDIIVSRILDLSKAFSLYDDEVPGTTIMAINYQTENNVKPLDALHGVSTFTPLKGLFIQGPISVNFFLVIHNMVEKVPSFQNGGISWFIDLTTADTFYILPYLTAF